MGAKIKLIDAICERHPSYGVEKGWSEYTGGMKDSGHWFFRKMLDVPLSELQTFLAEIILEESKPKFELSNQERADIEIIYGIGSNVLINKYTIKKETQMNEAIERLFFLGSDKERDDAIKEAKIAKEMNKNCGCKCSRQS